MAFIIVYYVSLIINALTSQFNLCARFVLRLCVCVVFFISLCTASHAFERGYNPDSGYINFKLSPPIKEAVDNGIAITFYCKLKVNKSMGLIPWSSEIENHTFILLHHSLSNRYLVRINNIETPKNFHTIGEATNFIMEKSIKFFKQYSAQRTSTQMRLSLNKFKLPGPIRLNAFIADYWNIDTGWVSWSSEI